MTDMLPIALLFLQSMEISDPRAFPPTIEDYLIEESRAGDLRRMWWGGCLHQQCATTSKGDPLIEHWKTKIVDWTCEGYFDDGRLTGSATCNFNDRRFSPARCSVQFQFDARSQKWLLLQIEGDAKRFPDVATAECQTD